MAFLKKEAPKEVEKVVKKDDLASLKAELASLSGVNQRGFLPSGERIESRVAYLKGYLAAKA